MVRHRRSSGSGRALAPRIAELEAGLKTQDEVTRARRFRLFSEENSAPQVQAAKEAWNRCEPERVARAYSEDTEWRNRVEFLRSLGRWSIFSDGKWNRDSISASKKTPACPPGNPSRCDSSMKTTTIPANGIVPTATTNWEFDDMGYMKFRFTSINDQPIKEIGRRFGVGTEAVRPCEESSAPAPHRVASLILAFLGADRL